MKGLVVALLPCCTAAELFLMAGHLCNSLADGPCMHVSPDVSHYAALAGERDRRGSQIDPCEAGGAVVCWMAFGHCFWPILSCCLWYRCRKHSAVEPNQHMESTVEVDIEMGLLPEDHADLENHNDDGAVEVQDDEEEDCYGYSSEETEEGHEADSSSDEERHALILGAQTFGMRASTGAARREAVRLCLARIGGLNGGLHEPGQDMSLVEDTSEETDLVVFCWSAHRCWFAAETSASWARVPCGWTGVISAKRWWRGFVSGGFAVRSRHGRGVHGVGLPSQCPLVLAQPWLQRHPRGQVASAPCSALQGCAVQPIRACPTNHGSRIGRRISRTKHQH